MPSDALLGSGNIGFKLKSDSPGAFNPHCKRQTHWARSPPRSKISVHSPHGSCSLFACPASSAEAPSVLFSLPRPTASPRGQNGLPHRAGSFHLALPSAQYPLAWAGPEPPAAFLEPRPVGRAPREGSPASPAPAPRLLPTVSNLRMESRPRTGLPLHQLSGLGRALASSGDSWKFHKP